MISFDVGCLSIDLKVLYDDSTHQAVDRIANSFLYHEQSITHSKKKLFVFLLCLWSQEMNSDVQRYKVQIDVHCLHVNQWSSDCIWQEREKEEVNEREKSYFSAHPQEREGKQSIHTEMAISQLVTASLRSFWRRSIIFLSSNFSSNIKTINGYYH